MDSEQQQQGAVKYAVVDKSKKKQKRNQQQNVSKLIVSNVLLQETRRMLATAQRAPGFLKLFWFICQYECVPVPVSLCLLLRAFITSGMV